MTGALRGATMGLVAVLATAGLWVVAAPPAHADVTGWLQTAQGNCLGNDFGTIVAISRADCASDPDYWALEIVARVGDSPRYRVRTVTSNAPGCLVAYASTGRVGLHHTCNSAWADQVWAFQFVKYDADGVARFWLRNKHSGRCLGLNLGYATRVFMTTCADYRDQLWRAPGS